MLKKYYFLFVIFLVISGFTNNPRAEWTEWIEWSDTLDCNYSLHVDSEPQGAEVYVAEKYYDKTPCTIMIDFKAAFIWESRELYKYYHDNGQEKKARIDIEARNYRVEVQEGVNDSTIVEVYKGGYKATEKLFYLLPEKAVLIDNNPVLINVYRVIKEDVEELIESLRNHKNEEDYFYKIRSLDRDPKSFSQLSNIKKASRTIYMNKCCYNGLYRVNSKGQFNVPFGRYKNPNFCDEKNLKAVNMFLQNAKIIQDSFERCLDFTDENTFIYLDPPYFPLSKTASFTSYTKENFTKEDQIQLKKIVDKLTERGCKVMLSNSHNEFILNLYEDYSIKEVRAKRAINCNALKRGAIKEALIMNY